MMQESEIQALVKKMSRAQRDRNQAQDYAQVQYLTNVVNELQKKIHKMQQHLVELQQH